MEGTVSIVPTLDLSTAVTIDLIVFTVCSFVLLYRGGLRHSHPAVIYLAFHALVFSSRAVAINSGAPTFLSDVPGLDGVRTGEIAFALLIADIALISATLGWTSARRPRTHLDEAIASPGIEAQYWPQGAPSYRPLQLKYVHVVAAIAMPLGLLALAKYGNVPGSQAQSLATSSALTSSYFTIAATWPGLILVALIYFHGFRPALLIPMIVYLGFISIQGYDRFRLIIPVLLLGQIFLDRRGKRWPGKAMLLLIAVGVLVFFPLKAIGIGIQQGEGFSTIATKAEATIQDALTGRNQDQALLDELAITVSSANESGHVFLGQPYLNVVLLPIPRQLWPGKPGLADYLDGLSQPGRPLAQIGGVTTFPGDLYINFRVFGLTFIMFLLARLSGRACTAAYRVPYLSIGRFAYLLLASNLIQIYRDGLISIPVFLLVNMMPLVAIVALHLRGTNPASGLPGGSSAASVQT